jgi:hypothetical protein
LFFIVEGKKIDSTVLFFLVSFSLLALFFTFRGVLYNAPGAIRVLTVMWLWPMLFTFIGILFGNKNNENYYKPFLNSFLFVNYFLLLQCLLVFYANLFGLSHIISVLFGNIATGEYSNLPKYSISSLSTLVYTAPFCIALFFYLFVYKMMKENKKIVMHLFFILPIILIVTFLSGRKAIFIEIISAPFLMTISLLLINFSVGLKNILRLLCITMGILLLILLMLVFLKNNIISNILTYISSGFDFHNSINMDSYVRYLQFHSLITAWYQHPLLGAGFGNHTDFVRDPQQPWAYELFYVALLYQVGIIGILFYFMGIIWIIFQMLKICKKYQGSLYGAFVFSTLSGVIFFLIANATNPYLGKFSYMWVIFLPVAIINYERTKNAS